MCEYCQDYKALLEFAHTDFQLELCITWDSEDGYRLSVLKNDGKLKSGIGTNTTNKNINYCPMCGRALREKVEETK